MNYFDPTFGMDNSGQRLAKAIRLKIEAWVKSPWFVGLVQLYDGQIPDGPLDEALLHLERFSDKWDFRRIAREQGAATDDNQKEGQGSARWLSAATGFSSDLETRVLDAAKNLGLVNKEKPSRSDYEYVIALGGARLSCKLRPELAAETMRDGIRSRQVVLLGAARPIPDSERDATDTYAPTAKDEFDLIVAGGQRAFGFDASTFEEEHHDDVGNRNLSWIIRHFKTTFNGRSLPVLAMSAPSSDPNRRRANSADTLLFFLDHEKVAPGSRLLLVTSQIYVPYTQLEALRTIGLPRNVMVETIGVPSDRMPPLQGLTNANHYLQEIRSTIQASVRFCQAYPEND